MEQIWKDIEGTNGRYSISNGGQVRANWSDIPQRGMKTRKRIDKQRILQPWVHTTGYLRVSMGRNNCHYVHRLLAMAFIDNPNNLPCVDHIDGNRLNNSLDNLRWVSHRENTLFGGERHGWEPQRIANAKRAIHAHNKPLYLKFLSEGYSYRKIARLFNTSHMVISRVCKNS